MNIKMWSYWKYESEDELSIWQRVPEHRDGALVNVKLDDDDIYLKCTIDFKSTTALAAPGMVYSYTTKSMSGHRWSPIVKAYIPIILLGAV